MSWLLLIVASAFGTAAIRAWQRDHSRGLGRALIWAALTALYFYL